MVNYELPTLNLLHHELKMEQLGETEQWLLTELGCIYKITSQTEGKSYIGQCHLTKDKNEKPYLYGPRGRWNDHRYSSTQHPDRPFYKAVNKYGFDDFKIEVLLVRPLDELDDLELQYTRKYLTTYPHGYNAIGDCWSRHNIGKIITHRDLYPQDLLQRFYESLVGWLQQMLDDKSAHIVEKYKNETIKRVRVATRNATTAKRQDGQNYKYIAVTVYVYLDWMTLAKEAYRHSFGGLTVDPKDAYYEAIELAQKIAPGGIYEDTAKKKLDL